MRRGEPRRHLLTRSRATVDRETRRGPRSKREFTVGTDHRVGSQRFQWLHSADRSTLGLHAAGARFRSREGRRGRSVAPSSACKEARFWPGRASSREITVTASDARADSLDRRIGHDKATRRVWNAMDRSEPTKWRPKVAGRAPHRAVSFRRVPNEP